MLKKTILMSLLFLSVTGMAQKTKQKGDAPDNSSIAKYLDDGRIGNVSNLIRFRAGIAAITGYCGLSYEKKITRNFGMEVGGYFKPVKNSFLESFRLNAGTGYKTVASVNSGIGVLAYPKLYVSGKKINNGFFLGLRTMYKYFNTNISDNNGSINYQKNVNATSASAFITIGSHQQVGKRMVFGVEWGAGYVLDAYKNVNQTGLDPITQQYYVLPDKVNMHFMIPSLTVDMVIGYLF